jgi:hypothetical protein
VVALTARRKAPLPVGSFAAVQKSGVFATRNRSAPSFNAWKRSTHWERLEQCPDEEIRRGRALVEAARETDIHLLFHRRWGHEPGGPHFESKFQVERYLKKAVRATPSLCRPPLDFLAPHFLDGLRQRELRMALPTTRRLQHVYVRVSANSPLCL